MNITPGSPAGCELLHTRERNILGPIAQLDHALVFEPADVALTEAEPAPEHLICVLAQERRRRDLRRFAVEAHRKSRHPQIAIRVMLRLDDAAAFKGRLREEIP